MALAMISSIRGYPRAGRRDVHRRSLGSPGEIRAVSRVEQRVREGERLGFTKIAVPSRNLSKTELKTKPGTVLVPVKTVFDLLPLLKTEIKRRIPHSREESCVFYMDLSRLRMERIDVRQHRP